MCYVVQWGGGYTNQCRSALQRCTVQRCSCCEGVGVGCLISRKKLEWPLTCTEYVYIDLQCYGNVMETYLDDHEIHHL